MVPFLDNSLSSLNVRLSSTQTSIAIMEEVSISRSLKKTTWPMGSIIRNARSRMLEKVEMKVGQWSLMKISTTGKQSRKLNHLRNKIHLNFPTKTFPRTRKSAFRWKIVCSNKFYKWKKLKLTMQLAQQSLFVF